MELAEHADEFRRRGLAIAALSYDAVPVLADFVRRKQIPFPLLSDPQSEVIRRFGLLNPEYPEGNVAHGVPYPAIFVLDKAGVVREKSLEESYVARRTSRSLAARLDDGAAIDAPASVRRDERIAVRLGQSDAEAFPGNRLTLVVEVEIARGLHAYAAGEHRYRPLTLTLEPNPLVQAHPATLPPSRPFHFAPLHETVPVYEGRVRVLQDVTLASRKDLAALLATPEPILTIAGALDYQLCSDSTCHPPERLPVQWTVRVRPPEMERVPEALRRK